MSSVSLQGVLASNFIASCDLERPSLSHSV
jgi:hypothetical protein